MKIKETIDIYGEFPRKSFDWRHLNNLLFMWGEVRVRKIGLIRYTTSFTRPNSYHCCVRLHLNSGGWARDAHRPAASTARHASRALAASRPRAGCLSLTALRHRVVKQCSNVNYGDDATNVFSTPTWAASCSILFGERYNFIWNRKKSYEL